MQGGSEKSPKVDSALKQKEQDQNTLEIQNEQEIQDEQAEATDDVDTEALFKENPSSLAEDDNPTEALFKESSSSLADDDNPPTLDAANSDLEAKKKLQALQDASEDEKAEKENTRVAKAWDDFNDTLQDPAGKGKDDAEAAAEAMAKLLEIFFASAGFIVEAIKHPQEGFRFAKGEAKEDWDSAKEYIQEKVDDAKEVKDNTQKGYRGFKSLIEDLKTYAQNIQDKAKAKRDLSQTPEPQPQPKEPKPFLAEQSDVSQDDVTQDEVTQDEVAQDEVTQDDVTQDDVTQDEVAQDEVTQDDVTQDDVTQDEVAQDEVTQDEVTQDEVTQDEVTQDEVTQDEVAQDEVTQDQNAAPFEAGKTQKIKEPKPFLASQREVVQNQNAATKSEPIQATTFEPAKPKKETSVPKTFMSAQREMAETTPQSPPLQEAKQFTSVDAISALESVIEPLHTTLKQLMNGIESASKSDKPLSNDGQSNQQIIWQALETALNCAASAIKLAQKEQLFQISSFGANAFMQAFTQGTMPVEQKAEETTPVATMIRQGVPDQKTTKEGFGIVPPPPPPVAPGGEAATPGAPAADASSSNTNAPAAGETEATPTTSVKSSGGHGGRK